MDHNTLHDMYEQIALSPAADERIRAALVRAQGGQNRVITLHMEDEKSVKHKRHKIPMAALIAAAMVLALSVTALAVGVAHIALKEDPITVGLEDGTEEQQIQVGFDRTEEGPIAPMGVWILDVPDGYEQTDSITTANYARNMWENSEGSAFSLDYKKAGVQLGDVSIPADSQRQEVTVNGVDGILYQYQAGEDEEYLLLAWTDKEAGIGFTLSANDPSLDLTALAQTVRQTGDRPEPDENAREALAELGDWTVTDLPEGYSEYAVQGMPSKFGGESKYAYVRRFYSDDAGHTIELDHEVSYGVTYDSYVQYYRDNADISQEELDVIAEMGETVHGLGCTVTDVEVQGRPAGLVVDPEGVAIRLAWISEDGQTAFILSSDSLTGPELLSLAETVAQQ